MMLFPIAAIAVLWWLLSRSNVLARFAPDMIPRLTEKALSVLIVLAALFVLLHGNVYLALLMFGVSLWLLGRSTRMLSPRGLGGDVARVRSKRIEMDIDRATGAMNGRVIEGPQSGVPLDRLGQAGCQAIFDLCQHDDPEGARLLEAYLDRRFSGLRAAGQADRDPRREKARSSGRMSEEEAYQVLGLARGATRDDIVRSHRTVMKKWHPDQGGTAALAARANEAKEVLLPK